MYVVCFCSLWSVPSSCTMEYSYLWWRYHANFCRRGDKHCSLALLATPLMLYSRCKSCNKLKHLINMSHPATHCSLLSWLLERGRGLVPSPHCQAQRRPLYPRTKGMATNPPWPLRGIQFGVRPWHYIWAPYWWPDRVHFDVAAAWSKMGVWSQTRRRQWRGQAAGVH